jgi:predicted nucleic-acid-binding protein
VIGLDAGIVLSLLEGRTKRGRAAQNLLKRAEMPGEGFIHPLALAEAAHRLEGDYGLERAKVADYLDYILGAPEFTVEAQEAAFEALRQYRAGKARFSACLLAALNRAAGCEATVTFASADGDPAGFAPLEG